jgi:hypothetical protein
MPAVGVAAAKVSSQGVGATPRPMELGEKQYKELLEGMQQPHCMLYCTVHCTTVYCAGVFRAYVGACICVCIADIVAATTCGMM